MIEYKCPKCGSKVEVTILPTYPPQTKFKCSNPKCDYLHIEQGKIITIEAPLSKNEKQNMV